MQMARSIDSDYIDLSLMGIDFDGFEENMKKIMELPIKYLDSAHDKAVELIEDVHAMLWAPFPDGGVPNKLQTFKDPSSSNVITETSPTFVETKLVGENAEVSTPASLIIVENGFTGCTNMDAHETESVLNKIPGDHIEANDLCLLPEDSLTTEVYDSTTSEEIILWNPENAVKPPRPAEPTTISEDDYVPLDVSKVTEQVGLQCSGHSDLLENSSANYEEHIVLQSTNDPVEATVHETISHDLSTDVSTSVGESPMSSDDTTKSVPIRLRNVQENMKNDKSEPYYMYLRQNTSFKKMFTRNLSSKLQWSKKQTSVQQPMPARSQDEENLGYQLVSSSDDLDDDWEVL
ncbi:hypothetical protein QOZ80_1AG0001820 [Eleusine coracana subsp. coracana]|nr:hypothetical protein QOZ80_1AG0001820 [Eleusine coracana subsp. coracana]